MGSADERALRASPVEAPRPYQEQLLAKAAAGNVVAYLETGAGKTLVAALLMKKVLRAAPREQYALFVVDRVPLVVQQAGYVRRVLAPHDDVGMYYSGVGVETWGERRWAGAIASKRALFFTAQTLLNALRHDVLHFDDCALVVFDEAHHASKKHPFAAIMREFYWPLRRRGARVPRVFGMTASPVKVKRGENFDFCQDAVDTLERLLDASVVAVDDCMQHAVDEAVAKPDEFVLEYDNRARCSDSASTADALPYDYYEDEFALDVDDAPPHEPPDPEKLLRGELGAYALTLVARNLRRRNAACAPDSGAAAEAPPDEEEQGEVSRKVGTLATVLVRECSQWAGTSDNAFRCIVFVHRRVVAVGLASVLNVLLASCGTPRLSARAIVGCAGSAPTGALSPKMTQAQVMQTIRCFKDSEFGILVATNVVEEGLDVPACGLVVMFNGVAMPKSYIQSRGRARHHKSKYVVMLPAHGRPAEEGRRDLATARKGASVMTNVVHSGAPATETEAAPVEAPVEDEPCLYSRTTNAIVTATAAVTLLQDFCASLPKDKYLVADKVVRPEYNVYDHFCCEVTLPINAPVSRGVCEVPQTKKMRAKQLAALDAYTALYECGALDEHLFPKDYLNRYRDPSTAAFCGDVDEKQTKQRRDEAKLKCPTGQIPCLVTQPLPLRWEPESPPAAQCTKPEQERSIRLLKRAPNPANIEATSGASGDVQRMASEPGSINAYMYEIRVEIGARGLEHMPPASSMPRHAFLLAKPLCDEDLVVSEAVGGLPLFQLSMAGRVVITPELRKVAANFCTAVKGVFHERFRALDGNAASVGKAMPQNSSDFDPGFLLVPLDESRATATPDWAGMRLMFDVMQCSFVRPSGTPSAAAIAEYSKMYDAESEDASGVNVEDLSFSIVQSKHDTDGRLYFTGAMSEGVRLQSDCRPILGDKGHASFAEYYENHFGTEPLTGNPRLVPGFMMSFFGMPPTRPFFLVPSLCRRVPVSIWSLYIFTRMPFLQIFLAVQQCRRTLSIDSSVTAKDLGTALQPQRTWVHCAGSSYERLEFLGDAVLKLLTSIAVYIEQPHSHEGVMTTDRDRFVSNNCLCDLAQKHGLFNVLALTSTSVKPKKWPFHFGSPVEKKIMLGLKPLADTLESIIGLCYVKRGLVFSAKAVEALGIHASMVSVMTRAVGPPARRKHHLAHVDNRTSAPRLAAVEAILGYTFHNKEVLVEALTHGSYRRSSVGSYQRLEFLGDAVVGFVILKGFYFKYPDLDPAQLTALREPALSNELFGRVVLDHGLHKHLWADSKLLDADIADVEAAFVSTECDDDAFDELVMPKVLGDLLESLIGAVVVDCNMQLDAVTKVADRLLAKALSIHATPETVLRHPVTKALHEVQTRFNTQAEFVFRRPDPAVCDFQCDILAHKRVVGTGAGANHRKAKRAAALHALADLAAFDRARAAHVTAARRTA